VASFIFLPSAISGNKRREVCSSDRCEWRRTLDLEATPVGHGVAHLHYLLIREDV